MRFRSFAMLVCVSTACTTGASGQTRSAPREAPATRGQPERGATNPAPAPADRSGPANGVAHNDAAQRTGAALRQNGGSLLRASLAAQADPGQAKLTDVSFFAVAPPEPKVVRKHDLVTIVVREESQFNSEATTDFSKEADVEAAIEEFIRLKFHQGIELKGGAIGAEPPSIRMGGSREFKGEGTVDRRDRILTRITAEVLDVKPNGTLVLQARGRTRHDEEEQEFVLSGICRVEDITADNTVLSSQLFDMSLEKRTKGTVRQATRRGWGGKLLDAVSPF